MAKDGLESSAKHKHSAGGGFNRKRVPGKGYKSSIETKAPHADALEDQRSSSSSKQARNADTVRTRDRDPPKGVPNASTSHSGGDVDMDADAAPHLADAALTFPVNVPDALTESETPRSRKRKRSAGDVAPTATKLEKSTPTAASTPSRSTDSPGVSISDPIGKERTENADDPEKLWCYCAKPYGGHLMIECSNGGACPNRWVHAACEPLSEDDINALEHKDWYCRDCVLFGMTSNAVDGSQVGRPSGKLKDVYGANDDEEQEMGVQASDASRIGAQKKTDMAAARHGAISMARPGEDIGEVIAVKIRVPLPRATRNSTPAVYRGPRTHTAGIAPSDSAKEAGKSMLFGRRPHPVAQEKEVGIVEAITGPRKTKSSNGKAPSVFKELNYLKKEEEKQAREKEKRTANEKKEAHALFDADFAGLLKPNVNASRPAKGTVRHGKLAPDVQTVAAHNTSDHQDEEQEHRNPGENYNYYSTRSGWDDRIIIEESFERGRPMNNAPALTRQDAAAFIEAGQDDSSFTGLDAPPSPTGTILNEDAGKVDISGAGINPKERLGQQRMLRLLRGFDAAAVEYGRESSDDDDIEITGVNV